MNKQGWITVAVSAIFCAGMGAAVYAKTQMDKVSDFYNSRLSLPAIYTQIEDKAGTGERQYSHFPNTRFETFTVDSAIGELEVVIVDHVTNGFGGSTKANQWAETLVYPLQVGKVQFVQVLNQMLL